MPDLKDKTVDDALQTLRDVVNDIGPDHTVQICQYVTPPNALDAQEPCCLIGHVLFRWGIPLDDLLMCEGFRAVNIAQRLGASVPVALTLNEAQAVQDTARPWGAALAVAEAYVAARRAAGEDGY